MQIRRALCFIVMNSAKECVKEYEAQYQQGLRTLPELITALMRTAGEFDGEETIVHVGEEFLPDIRGQVADVPSKEEFFAFKASESESSLLYSGLLNLHRAIFKT